MKKNILIWLCVFAMLLGMVSCNGQNPNVPNTGDGENNPQSPNSVTEENTTPQEEIFEMDITTYSLNSNTKGIKILGERCLASSTQLNCDWTGSGIEMDIKHAGGDITFTASASSSCYFRAYVDGVECKNGDTVYFTVSKGMTQIVLKDIPRGEHRIKLIKVTGYTLARAQLHSVRFAGLIKESAPTDHDLYIEFVGDSICCGWGTIGTKDSQYTGQDGTLAYPLRLSEALNADYSVTALSGQGLLCGDPGMINGYLYESALRNTAKQYDFARQADIVVINIGTNDYNNRNSIDAASFRAAYLNFLKTVAEKNGEGCIIYCLYNTMNDTFYEQILSAVEEFGGTAKNVYTLKMIRATRGAASHPSSEENEYYAEFLKEVLQEHIK